MELLNISAWICSEIATTENVLFAADLKGVQQVKEKNASCGASKGQAGFHSEETVRGRTVEIGVSHAGQCPLEKCGQRLGCPKSSGQIGMILISMFNFSVTLHYSCLNI